MAVTVKKRPPAMLPPYSYELQYKRLLKKLVRTMKVSVKKHLLSIADELVKAAQPPEVFVQDVDDDWMQQLNDALADIARDMVNPVKLTQKQMEDIGLGTNSYNKKKWQQTIRQAYGVSPTAEDPQKYEQLLNRWAFENAALIQDIPIKTMQQIRDVSIDALQSGKTVDTVVGEVLDRMDVSDSRAELIARDQVAKLNGELTQSRQKDAGVDKYIWRTVGDERVRDSHMEVDGQTFSWDQPPTETDGNHPGEDYQCRCWAEPILPDQMEFELSLQEQDLEEAA